jgi:AraC-like DNA-binding protein
MAPLVVVVIVCIATRSDALLQKRCIDTQLYLQHDLTIQHLAKDIGTNRYYLSQYFSQQGVTYNDYINGLRIDHFVAHYRETVTSRHPFTVKQLAQESGYRSYSTFSLAFKRQTGMSVSLWMKSQ